MHPENIKAQLRIRGVTMADLAREFEVGHDTVRQVVMGITKSKRINNRIAEILNKTVEELWPKPKTLKPRK